VQSGKGGFRLGGNMLGSGGSDMEQGGKMLLGNRMCVIVVVQKPSLPSCVERDGVHRIRDTRSDTSSIHIASHRHPTE
jgi:hypothetical protein